MVEKTEIDTANHQMVGVRGEKIVILRPPVERSREEALVFAAHIVAIAEGFGAAYSFKEAYKAVCTA